MAETFQIEIATPERLLVSAQAMRAQIPAKEGYIGVLPDHAPLLSELGYGALTYTTANDHCFSFSVSGGYVEINGNQVRVLADDAEVGHEIDVTQAEKDLKRAQDEMLDPALALDIASALTAARHAQARIDAARKAKNGEE